MTKGNFDKKLNNLLGQIDSNKRHARNALTLQINTVIGTGNFGDVIRGNLKGEPTEVHVISGRSTLQESMMPFRNINFMKYLFISH